MAEAPGEEHDALGHLLFDPIRRRERFPERVAECREFLLALFAADDLACGEVMAQGVLRCCGFPCDGRGARVFWALRRFACD